jgi:diadenosine tetraphosphate (Ap4A) HIT family hydrolase
MSQLALWSSEHYRLVADEYPRCVGHVLLITKAHLVGHMDAPGEWLAELSHAQEYVRRFLIDTFGEAGFWEHGGPAKEVPHAHLHGLPVDIVLGAEWPEQGRVQRISDWSDVGTHHRETGNYVYAAGSDGAYLVLDEPGVLAEIRRQFVRKLGLALDPGGGLRRLGPDAVNHTREHWYSWVQR